MKQALEHDSTLPDGPAQAACLQRAVDQAHEAGGGTVSVGPGVYVMTTLFLRSGVALHLEHGARLVAHACLEDYPEVADAARNKDQSHQHLIVAHGCEDIAITGKGTIDGNDQAFWTPCKSEAEWPYGIFRYTVRGGHARRPSPLVQLVGCTRVKLRDVTLTSAPGWTLHVFNCDTVSIQGLTVRGDPYGPNTDGIGINGSRDVRISDCDVDTGDDAIIIKATNPDSVCERVTVTNCVLASNCAALGLGADVEGVIRDVVFSNCVVRKSLRMIQVEMWFPGQVERAVFSGISGRTFPDEGIENERPIYVDIQQFNRTEPTLGHVSDLVFRDILCESRGRIVMTAQDGAVLDGITLDTVTVTVPEIEDPQETVPRARSMQLSNFNPHTRAVRAAVVADNVHDLTLRNVAYRWPESLAIPMHGLCLRNCENVIDDSPRLQASDAGCERVVRMDEEKDMNECKENSK
jgi:hypothetical protein